MNFYGWITQLTNKKDLQKQKLLKELIESSKSGEDKLIAARAVANEDSQKAATATRSEMKRSAFEM